jgi:hypothetical protein
MDMSVGIGYLIPKRVTDAINFVLTALNVKHRIGSSGGLQTKPHSIVKWQGWEPDVPVCKLS